MNDEPDDLRQIFGYEGAIPDDSDLLTFGDEIYTMQFWTPRFCQTVIRAAEAVGAFEPNDDDPVPGRECRLKDISPTLFNAVEIDIGMRVFPKLREVWPYIDYHGLNDVFVIKYALGEQESLRMHHDVAQISASVKLNNDYVGAVLDFPRQGVSNESLGVGEMIVWPSLVTHPHQATQLVSGVKYALTVWFELPGFYAG